MRCDSSQRMAKEKANHRVRGAELFRGLESVGAVGPAARPGVCAAVDRKEDDVRPGARRELRPRPRAVCRAAIETCWHWLAAAQKRTDGGRPADAAGGTRGGGARTLSSYGTSVSAVP